MLHKELLQTPLVQDVRVVGESIEIRIDGATTFIANCLPIDRPGIPDRRFRQKQMDLEDVFMNVTKEAYNEQLIAFATIADDRINAVPFGSSVRPYKAAGSSAFLMLFYGGESLRLGGTLVLAPQVEHSMTAGRDVFLVCLAFVADMPLVRSDLLCG